MRNIIQKNHCLITTIIIFLIIAKVFGMHAHGHIDISHEHDETVFVNVSSVTHQHLMGNSHIEKHFGEVTNSSHEHDPHTQEAFDINIIVLLSKIFENINFDLLSVVVISLFALISFQFSNNGRIAFDFHRAYLQRQYFICRLLRAPPIRA